MKLLALVEGDTMVTISFAKIGPPGSSSSVTLAREEKTRVAEARLRHVASEFVGNKRATPADFDFRLFWNRKIIEAMNRNRTETSNFGWFINGRCGSDYVCALQELLGPEFTVESVKGLFGGRWTHVSW